MMGLGYDLSRGCPMTRLWELRPFGEGVPLTYQAAFDHPQFARLMNGFEPRSNDDKWTVYYNEPYLTFHLGVSRLPVYRVTLRVVPTGAEISEALWSKDVALTAKTGKGPDYQVRILDHLIFSVVLGMKTTFSPLGGRADMPTTKRPRWRFW
jgi:hypothetical protein